MRQEQDFGNNWRFACGEEGSLPQSGAGLSPVRLPHCWEPAEGFLSAVYKNVFLPNLGWHDKEVYLFAERLGAKGKLYLNDTLVWESDSEAEPLMARLTGNIRWTRENTLLLYLHAGSSKYAGLFTGIKSVEANPAHFSPEIGANGLVIEPVISGGSARVNVKCSARNAEGALVRLTLLAPDGSPSRQKVAEASSCISQTIDIPDPKFWRGKEARYMYTIRAQLFMGNKCVDDVRRSFGLRTIDSRLNAPFLLNGEPYPIRGVLRKAEYPGHGWAIPENTDSSDIAAIEHMGANCAVLSDGRVDDAMLSLCDESGIIVFAQLSGSLALTRETISAWSRLYGSHPSLCAVILPECDPELIQDIEKGIRIPGEWLCAVHGGVLPAIASLAIMPSRAQSGSRPSIALIGADSQPAGNWCFIDSLTGQSSPLLSLDRSEAYDSYFRWMALWSERPFVRIAEVPADSSQRHINIRVITNQSGVTLSVNGRAHARRNGAPPEITFVNVPLTNGDNTVIVSIDSGESDAVVITREKTGLFARWRAKQV